MIPLSLHPDRLFSSDPAQRDLSRALYATIRQLPIVSPHGHTDPQWYADNEPFTNASVLLITPDHYVFRMLYSQGVKLEDLAIPRRDGGPVEQDGRKIWRTFATNYRLFRGTPTRVWLDHAFHEVFGVRERLTPESADRLFDQINDCLAKPEFRPRALFERFNIEVIATTESPLDPLAHHAKLRASGRPCWRRRSMARPRPRKRKRFADKC
jgi:glucuronate isomerase